ncbi:MAG TPA: S8 family serine peptidase [Thermoanaerobaculia bacterium]|nr:S8 family serine peptidase [Thermoanaerobaculia bacterium]
MTTTTKPRLLLKLAAPTGSGFTAAPPTLKLQKVSFELERLFQNAPPQPGLAARGRAEWFVAEPASETAEMNAWDLAHQALRQGFGMAGAPAPTFVEPDLQQTWIYQNAAPLVRTGEAFAAADVCQFHDQSSQAPRGPAFAWFLGDPFSQLKAARDAVGEGARRVRIAHLDTGYDPRHVTLPAHLNLALQHNFVEANRPNDASDPAVRGTLTNPGHGTGTLSILAGNKLAGMPRPEQNTGDFLGGAPLSEIVPIRVASSVVLFFTSAIARALDYVLAPLGDPRNRCDVVSLSMGGLPSAAWTDAVNAAYEAGITIVAAAGNNFSGLPTRNIVYPARYQRVIAACGRMADRRPYFNLPRGVMEGNFGPASKMATALAAFTPNMSWAELGCDHLIDMDGAGTSAATPQVAAAAALWLQKHNPAYDEPWKRVEAVRRALFTTAAKDGTDVERFFGNGSLQAKNALAVLPATDLRKTPRDSASFPLLRVLTGLGIAADPTRTDMHQLEILQLLQRSQTLEQILPDPEIDPAQIAPREVLRFFEALIEEPGCSQSLKAYVQERYTTSLKPQVPAGATAPGAPAKVAPAPAAARRTIPVAPPAFRKLRIYAFDPSLGTQLETAMLNQATVKVPWEQSDGETNLLAPGPVGEYLEVVDYDPASGCFYAPVDLNDPFLLAQDGLAPSEGNPQFHQQMAYAVAMTTIRNFERALGRVALWSPRHQIGDRYVDAFVRRLRIYPHALREANAFYSPERKALLFGYFPASLAQPGRNLPGGIVFTCLSHDVVAHETTHALLDGLHRRFAEPSNPDVLAFHEAFADIVALFQHFTYPEAVKHQIARTRGDLGRQNLLGELAQQFGQAIGQYGALRDAIGKVDPATGEWRPIQPDPTDYQTVTEPHQRGAILVAAVFDAFLAIYKSRIGDLLRIATSGTGVLPEGEIHPDLVNRLAAEANKSAGHILAMCIRALDYCPPVDMTFGDYLRALVTADADLVPDDDLGYRIAFIEAFRRRGIYPSDVRTLSAESLRWQEPTLEFAGLKALLGRLDLGWKLTADRRHAFDTSRQNCIAVHEWLLSGDVGPDEERQMGLALGPDAPAAIGRGKWGGQDRPRVEVHSVRPARRVGPDGQQMTDLVIEITQKRVEPLDREDAGLGALTFRGGATLLVDLETARVRYCVAKSITSEERLAQQRRFQGFPTAQSLHATYFGESGGGEPFAALHRGL